GELAQGMGDRLLEIAAAVNDPLIEAKALWNLMLLEDNIKRDYFKAIEFGEASLAIARAHNLVEPLAYTLHDLSRSYKEVSRIEESLDAAIEADRLFRTLNQPAMVIDNLALTADISFQVGELEKARHYGEEALELSRKTGSLWGLGYSGFTLAPIYVEFAEFEAAIDSMELSIQAWSVSNAVREFYFLSVWILAWIYASAGDLKKAFDLAGKLNTVSQDEGELVLGLAMPEVVGLTYSYLYFLEGDTQKASETLGEIPDQDAWFFQFQPPVPALVSSLICDIAMAAGDFQPALSLAQAAIQVVRQSGARPYMADLLLCEGEALIQTGMVEQGLRSLNMALSEAELTHSRRAEIKILARWGALEYAQGERDQSEKLLIRARKLRDTIATSIKDEKLRELFLASRLIASIEGE
ncbi:MAG TPA: hypothetical protein VJ768_09825, partial [Anaerolineales bacterium]|nr:hypothetical protein [Anaerolineales bacterium]